MHLYIDVSPKFHKTEFTTALGGDAENPWLQVLETLLSSHIKLCINSSTLRSLPYIFLLFLNLLHSQIMSGWPFFLKQELPVEPQPMLLIVPLSYPQPARFSCFSRSGGTPTTTSCCQAYLTFVKTVNLSLLLSTCTHILWKMWYTFLAVVQV